MHYTESGYTLLPSVLPVSVKIVAKYADGNSSRKVIDAGHRVRQRNAIISSQGVGQPHGTKPGSLAGSSYNNYAGPVVAPRAPESASRWVAGSSDTPRCCQHLQLASCSLSS
jgi:hypothetical protein